MAANLVGNTFLNLKDQLAQTEKGEITSTIIDLLTTTNDLLKDAIAVECNEGSQHKTTVRNGLPEPEFRQYYQGVNCSKGNYTQITDTTGMLEDYSECDQKLVDKNKNPQQFRLNESTAHLEGMNNTVLENIFYGNKATNPAAFDGLAIRYNIIDSEPASKSIGSRVVDAGGRSTNCTSIWFITWGNLHTNLLYPENSQAGIQHEDLGKVTTNDNDNKKYEAYRDHYSWDIGLSVRNYQSIARIANIDIFDLEDGKVDLEKFMIKAYHKVKKFMKTGKLVIYTNEFIQEQLHQLAVKKSNSHLSFKEFGGEEVLSMFNIPIRTVEQISNHEDWVRNVNGNPEMNQDDN